MRVYSKGTFLILSLCGIVGIESGHSVPSDLKNQNSRQPVNRQLSSVSPATPPQTVAAPAPLQIPVSTPQDNNARWTAKEILQAIGLVFTALGLFYT